MVDDKTDQHTIMIVDDNPENLNVLNDFLKKYSFTIVVASNGKEVFQRLEFCTPDIVLLDILMPEMDGFETCQRLKKSENYKHIPVIFMSALADTIDKVKGLEYGAVDYITKPFDLNEVLARIRTHLELKDTQQKLRYAQESLEKRVRERTAKLAASEAKYRRLIESLERDYFIYSHNTDGVFTYVSPSIKSVLGYDQDEFLGSYDKHLTGNSINEKVLECNRAAISGETVPPYELEIRHKDCSARLFNIVERPVFDEQNKVIAVEGIAHDITIQKKVEREIEHTNRILRTISRTTFALIRATDETTLLNEICRIVVEVGGYHMAWIGLAEDDENKSVRPVAHKGFEDGYLDTLHISWANCERGQGLTGIAIRTASPSIARNILSDDRFKPWRDQAIKRGYSSSISLPMSIEEKVIGALNIYSTLIDAFGKKELELLVELSNNLSLGIHTQRLHKKLKKYQGNLEKLVQEKTAELKLANERLKELDRLKSMFIASMSHELRTPLNSIIGFTGLMLQGISGEINDRQEEELGIVYLCGKHLLALISDIIDISKIESGHIDIYTERFSLRELVDEAATTIHPQIEKKNIDLKIEANSLSEIHTDRKRLMQCLLNLLSNAEKYSEKGSVTIIIEEKDENVELSVRDTGIGIAKEDMPLLFEAFERLENKLRVKAGGTGLGLYLTKIIVCQLLQGKISVNSTEGKGSTFTISIPKQINHKKNNMNRDHT